MRTVKEVSELTGVSTRTLHYYDEIGLFPPTDKSEAGYRQSMRNMGKVQQSFLHRQSKRFIVINSEK